LRRLERKCFAARNRFAFYDYLAAVFDLYVQLRRRNEAKPTAWRIAKLFGLRKSNRTHPIRTIIDATSTTEGFGSRRELGLCRTATEQAFRRGTLEDSSIVF
jgi:hypothetical protein